MATIHTRLAAGLAARSIAGLLLLLQVGADETRRHDAAWTHGVLAAGGGDPSTPQRTPAASCVLPVGFLAAFVENVGQWQGPARFAARRGDLSVHACDDCFAVVLAKADGGPPAAGAKWLADPIAPQSRSPATSRLQATALRFRFEACSGATRPEGREPVPTRFNYFLGDDHSRWRAGVTGYRCVWYPGLYAGVDLALHAGERAPFEYDLHVAPGASLDQVVLGVEGAVAPLRLDEDGTLVVMSRLGEVRQPRPRAFAASDRGAQEVECSYEILSPNRFRFRAPAVEPTSSFVIDPQLLYSTYLGGTSWDEVFAVAFASDATVVIAGRTFSSDFPTQNAFQSTLAGPADVFVARLDLAGGPPAYATYLGGSAEDEARALALDASGGPILAGATRSSDFPTQNAFQTSNAGLLDAFVTRLSPAGGQLVSSTYFGGSGVDAVVGVALDSSGGVVVAGSTASIDFPTRGAFQASNAGGFDAFLARIPLAGGPPAYSTYLGGSLDDGVTSLALDTSGAAVLAGWTESADFPVRNAFQTTLAGAADAFVALVPLSGAAPTCSTYLGGGASDVAYVVAVDAGGTAVVVGGTSSTDFPTQNAFRSSLAGPSDAFVTRLPLSGAPPVASTYLGGASTETALALALDARGDAVVAGWTFSSDFPLAIPLQASNAGGADVFLARLPAAGGAPTYSSYLGGSGLDKAYAAAVDSSGAALVVGLTDSTNFPIRNPLQPRPAGSYDVFVTLLELLPPGTTSYGSSTPGCAGSLPIGATSSARVGNGAFALTCDHAPPSAIGLLGLSSSALTTPVVVLGAAVWLDPAAPVFTLVLAGSTAAGAASVPAPLPSNPSLVGARVFAQFFWADVCAAGGISASYALAVTVQP